MRHSRPKDSANEQETLGFQKNLDFFGEILGDFIPQFSKCLSKEQKFTQFDISKLKHTKNFFEQVNATIGTQNEYFTLLSLSP